MRLIDADALIEALHKSPTVIGYPYFKGRTVYECISNAPTIDAVPVVRCKECKRWDEVTQVCDKFSHPHCAHLVGATGFCKWAERKDNDTERG